MSEFLQMLDLLFGSREGFLCLAHIPSNKGRKRLKQVFIRWPNADAVETWVQEHAHLDCYYCPHLLREPRRRKAFALDGHTVWADLDTCQPQELGRYGEPMPSILIESSPSRWQGLWLLETELKPREYEALNKRIAYAYADKGCDTTGWDVTQLLRVPSTTHSKGTPFTVRAEVEEVKYSPDMFKGLPPVPQTPAAERVSIAITEVRPIRVEKLKVSRTTKDLILNPPEKGKRSEATWAVMQDMIKHRYSASTIFAVMKGNPIGQRYVTDESLAADIKRAFEKREEEIMTQREAEAYQFPTLEELRARAGAMSNIIPNMLSRGEIVLYYGAAKAGKTMQCQDMAASLIVGEPIFGIFPIEQAFRVAYLSFEMSAQELVQRFEIRTKGRGSENLRVERYSGATFPNPQLIETIRAGTESFRPDVVFLDPLINMHSLNENDAQDMHSVLDPIRNDAEAKDYGVILVHHTGVERQDDAGRPLKRRPRGSSAIEACADLTIVVNLSQSKYVRTIETDLIRSVGVTDWKYKIVYNPETLDIRSVLEGDVYDGVIADILTQAGGGMVKKQLVEMIRKRTGLKGSQPYKLIDKAQEADKVKVHGEGRAQVVILPQREDIDDPPF